MDTNIEKSYPKLKNVKPYGKNEVIPDEIKNWEEFDRALVTFIVDCVDHSEDNNNNGKKWYGIHRIQDISLSVWKPESRSYHSAWKGVKKVWIQNNH